MSYAHAAHTIRSYLLQDLSVRSMSQPEAFSATQWGHLWLGALLWHPLGAEANCPPVTSVSSLQERAIWHF